MLRRSKHSKIEVVAPEEEEEEEDEEEEEGAVVIFPTIDSDVMEWRFESAKKR
jgi:hypothetical protein